MKKHTFDYMNATYKVEVSPDCGGRMAVVSLYRATSRKFFFPWAYVGSSSFWVEDYESIAEGAEDAIGGIIAKNAEELEQIHKWEEFDKV